SEGLGDNGGVITEGRREHARAHQDARCPCPQRAQPRYGKRGMTVGVTPSLEMIADENRVKAALFSQNGKAQQLVGTELFRGRLVTQSEQSGSPSRTQAYRKVWCADGRVARCDELTPGVCRRRAPGRAR